MTKIKNNAEKTATAKLNLANPVHLLATGFGSGLSPKMPGTVGTLAAIPFYVVFVSFSAWVLVAAIIIGAIAGIYLCGKTAEDMGTHDHGSIVWDEFVGFWLTMLLVPITDWRAIALGFVLFRLFDITKPWPISWIDKKIHGGFGIMLDDIAAGVCAMFSLWFIYFLFIFGW